MKSFIKSYWKHLLIFTLAGIIGGFLMGLDLLSSYPEEIRNQVYAQGLNDLMLSVITGIQYAGYGLVLGAIGIIIAKKIGLWNDSFSLKSKPLVTTVIIFTVGGILFIGLDVLLFGKLIPAVGESYLVKPTVATLLGSIILGGVVEEVMLRLFMMSLIAFAVLKIFKGLSDKKELAFIIANIISAILFAAGHLPLTAVLFGITPIILFRCFLLNGGFGLAFGWLYRKHGLQYAMIAHAGLHLVSKIIWILLV